MVAVYAALPAPAIALSLMVLLRNSLSAGRLRCQRKHGKVKPVHKKESTMIAGDYRQISLLLMVGKVFETIVNHCLYNRLAENNLLSLHQSGFRCSSDSCIL